MLVYHLSIRKPSVASAIAWTHFPGILCDVSAFWIQQKNILIASKHPYTDNGLLVMMDYTETIHDSSVRVAIWVLLAPGGLHVGSMNLAIRTTKTTYMTTTNPLPSWTPDARFLVHQRGATRSTYPMEITCCPGSNTDPGSNVYGVNMGPTWVLSASDGPHVGPMKLAIRGPFDYLVYIPEALCRSHSITIWIRIQ